MTESGTRRVQIEDVGAEDQYGKAGALLTQEKGNANCRQKRHQRPGCAGR